MKWIGLREGLILVATAALAGVWGYTAHVGDRIRSRQMATAIGNAENVAKGFESGAIGTLREIATTLDIFALRFRDGNLPAALDLIDHGYYNQKLITGFAIVGDGGAVTYQSRPDLLPANAGDYPAVANQRDGAVSGLYIDVPFLEGDADGSWRMFVSRRLATPDGRPSGVLLASVDPLYFLEFFTSVSLGAGGAVALVGMDGTVRLRRTRDGVEGAGSADPQLLSYVRHTPAGVYRLAAGRGVGAGHVAYRRLDGFPLVVTVGVAGRDIEAAASGIQRMIHAAATILSIAIVIIAGVIIAQRRTAERLRLALKVNRDFLARVSHELRTPLNAIIGFSEMIKDQMLGPNALGRYAEYARDIHASGLELLGLVNDILDLTGLQAGRTALALEPVDVDAAIDWAVRVMGPQAESKAIALDKTVLPGVDRVMGDVRAIRQMLLNLLSNAVKFTPEGGRIVIVALAGRGRKGCLLRVCDTGIGMTPEQIEQVTIPFGQDSALAARNGQGHGLGLSIVKALIEAHGGQLRIRSHPGRGSQVTLEFAA